MTRSEDDTLSVQVARGEQDAFARLFDRHVVPVIRYAWALAERRADVEDIVQETFLVAWRRRRELPRDDDALLPWLLVTCRNLAANSNRRGRRTAAEPLDEDVALTAERDRRDASASAERELRWVRDQLDALPPAHRRLAELCLIEGVPYDEASARLGIAPAAARKRVQRIRERLRSARSQRGDE